MASRTLDVATLYPDGTTLNAYVFGPYVDNPDGTPPPAATATAVSSGGTVTFTGLADGTRYYAGLGTDPWRYFGFSTPAVSTSGASGVDLTARGALAGVQKLTSYCTFVGEVSASFPPMSRPIDPSRTRVIHRNLGATAEQVVPSSNLSNNYNAPNWTGAAPMPVNAEVVVTGDVRAMHFRTTVDGTYSLTGVFTEQGVL